MAKNEESLIQFEPGSKFNGWKIGEKLLDWGHGAAYKVLKEKLPYLMKIEKTGHDEILKYEVHVLQELAKVSAAGHISKIEETEESDTTFSYVVLTLFGKTLKDLYENALNNKFSRGTAVSAAIQCLKAIESFHANGYFLQNTQPTNFAIGRSEFNQTREIFVLNVYMAKKYKKDDGTLKVVFWSSTSYLRPRYASISYHKKQKIRCIDEIESWFYMVVEWTCGGLPWAIFKDTDQRNILQMKKLFLKDSEEFLDGCPSAYLQILKFIGENQDTEYYDTSIYEQIYDLLHQSIKNVQIHHFDWEVSKMKQQVIESKRNVNVASFKWSVEESWFLKMDFCPGTCQLTDFKYIDKHKNAKYRIELYQRGIPNSEYQFGSWIILKLINYNLDTNIDAKYTVKIPSADFTKECHHIFEKNEVWEMYGCKITELFNPKKKYFVDGIMDLKFDFEFDEIEKDFVEETDNLSIGSKEEVIDKSPEKAVYSFSPVWRISLEKIETCLPNECIESPVFSGDNEFTFYFEFYPKFEESNDFEDGAWIFLCVKNLNGKTFLESKYLFDSRKAKYLSKGRQFFKRFNEWEKHGVKIDEIMERKFLSKQKKEISIIIEMQFAIDFKEIELKNDEDEEAYVNGVSLESSDIDVASECSTSVTTILTEENKYYPPTDSWLKNECASIGIKFFENISKFRPSIDDIQKFIVRKPDDVISVEGDGKCGYRALSVLISGKEDHHVYIKNIICRKITKNKDPNFEKMGIFKDARRNAAFKLKFDSSDADDKRFWMDDSDIAAAANLFDCNIFVFTRLKYWQCYGPKTYENGITENFGNFDSKLPTLLLDNAGGNHFSPVKNVRLKR
uniref:Protein kinase domain-containing protein n=1 Tax=Panagrolaimus sp. PS1159 TaxID=55785 RepID=A0AC35ESU1_9BILA